MDGACLRCGRSDGRTRAGGVDCLNCRESGVLLSICIQAHPARALLVERLLEALRPAQALVALADESERPNPLATYLKALRLAPHWASHQVVIQDDVQVCSNFLPAATAALEARPDGLLAFFTPQPPEMAHRISSALDRGESFAVIPCRRWVPVVALCWPRALIGEFLEFVERQDWPQRGRADDDAVGRFVREQRLEVLATAPSLVEHPDTEPSLVGRRTRGGRLAAHFIGDADPLEIVWT